MRDRRHPAEVTADRLLEHYEKWNGRLSGSELDAISIVRNALQNIAEEDEAAAGDHRSARNSWRRTG
jgi:hypothetical protein